MNGSIDILIDDSFNHRAIIVTSPLIRKRLNDKLQEISKRPVHMKNLRSGDRFGIATRFAELIQNYVKLASYISMEKEEAYLELNNIIQKIQPSEITVYLDRGLEDEFEEKCRNIFTKFRHICYINKGMVQSADVLAWINTHKKVLTHIKDRLNFILE